MELNASIGITLSDRHLQRSLWGKNPSNAPDLVTCAPPRQVGLSIEYQR